MGDNVTTSIPNSLECYNLASLLKKSLESSCHEWLYCFLNRGGDAKETYLSPKELLEASEHLARRLIEVTPKDTMVILSMDHGPDFLIALLACIFAKITVVPAPIPRFGSNSERLTSIAKICDTAFILTKQQNFPTIENVLSKEEGMVNNRLLSMECLLSGENAALKRELPGFSADIKTLVIIQFTSGSTGDPKGVMISSENVLANQQEVATRWHFHHDKTVLSWLPYFHDMGLFGGLLYPLLGGLKVIQMDPIHLIQKPQRWLSAMSKFRVNISGGPAFAYDLCNDLDVENISSKIDLSSWQIAFCGADYVPSSTMQQFRNKYSLLGLKPSAVMPVYGLAEATLFVAGQPNTNACDIAKYEGNDTEGCYLGAFNPPNIVIRDVQSSKIMNNGEIGEICFSGPSVTNGYYKIDTNDFGNIVKTGDLGFIKNNYLFICGRIKDVIIRYGQNISPTSIEQIAISVSDQLNPHAAAAIQINDHDDNIVLFLEIKKTAHGKLANQSALRTHITERVQQRIGVTLSNIVFLKRGELMRTSSGKVQRQSVAEHYQSGHTFSEADNIDD